MSAFHAARAASWASPGRYRDGGFDLPSAPTLAVRMARRRALGRPVNGSTSYIRADTGLMVTEHTDRVDPILLLKSVRRFARSAGWGAQEYGRVLALAMSPVCLPEAMQAPARFRLAA